MNMIQKLRSLRTDLNDCIPYNMAFITKYDVIIILTCAPIILVLSSIYTSQPCKVSSTDRRIEKAQ